MNFIRYSNKTPVNLEQVFKIKKAHPIDTITNKKVYDIIFFNSHYNQSVAWRFTDQLERDKVYDKVTENFKQIIIKL